MIDTILNNGFQNLPNNKFIDGDSGHTITETQIKFKMIRKSLDELQRKDIYSLMNGMSSRIDKLEEFISEETKYDGVKVHQLKLGEDKKNWLK